MYEVIATRPLCGPGSFSASRVVGPFVSRQAAEDAAARMVDDPRQYGRISITTVEDEDPAA